MVVAVLMVVAETWTAAASVFCFRATSRFLSGMLISLAIASAPVAALCACHGFPSGWPMAFGLFLLLALLPAHVVGKLVNVRTHDKRHLEAIQAGLARFVRQKSFVIDAKGVVVTGNGTLEAAEALGSKKTDVVRIKLTGSEAMAFAIANNRTSELAAWITTHLGDLPLPIIAGSLSDECPIHNPCHVPPCSRKWAPSRR